MLDLLGVVAIVGLGVAWWKLEGDNPFLYCGGLWLTEIAAVVLIACATTGASSLVGRALSLRPLPLLGTLSYGIYLWHWPVNVFLTPERVHARGLALHVLHLAVTFAIAGASYFVIERPIRTRGVPFGRPVYMVPAAVALAVLLVVRATYARAAPLPALPPPASLAVLESADAAPPEPPFQIMLFGDSTANSLGWGLRGLQKSGLAVDLKGQDGCTMLADMCGGPGWAEQAQKACHRQWDHEFESTLARRFQDLKAPGAHVWAVTIPYAVGVWESSALRAEVDCINTSIRKAAGAVPGVRVLELAQHLCPGGDCEVEFEGAVIRPDGVHYSVDGARGLSRWVLDQIQR
jgi:hypothetical protein